MLLAAILITVVCLYLTLPKPKAGYRDPGERGPWNWQWLVVAGVVWGAYLSFAK